MHEQLNKEAFDQIQSAFLDKWLEGLKQVPERMKDVDDTNWRNFLTSYDPSLSKVIEGNTREVVRNALEKGALANAVTYAILTAHNILK